jgi:hypothetical protein
MLVLILLVVAAVLFGVEAWRDRSILALGLALLATAMAVQVYRP